MSSHEDVLEMRVPIHMDRDLPLEQAIALAKAGVAEAVEVALRARYGHTEDQVA